MDGTDSYQWWEQYYLEPPLGPFPCNSFRTEMKLFELPPPPDPVPLPPAWVTFAVCLVLGVSSAARS